MFKEAGFELYVHCDYEARSLRVAIDIPLLPGFLGTWREVGAFKSREEWVASSFYKQVTNEDIEEMIEWFWMDLSTEGISGATKP